MLGVGVISFREPLHRAAICPTSTRMLRMRFTVLMASEGRDTDISSILYCYSFDMWAMKKRWLKMHKGLYGMNFTNLVVFLIRTVGGRDMSKKYTLRRYRKMYHVCKMGSYADIPY